VRQKQPPRWKRGFEVVARKRKPGRPSTQFLISSGPPLELTNYSTESAPLRFRRPHP